MNLFSGWGLRGRILGVVGLASLICASVAITGFLYFCEQELENGIISKQRTIHLQLEAATDYVARQGGLPSVIQRMRDKHQSETQMTEQDKLEVLKQVPIF